MNSKDPFDDFRSRFELEHQAAIERRRERVAQQTATANSPGQRLRIWEKLHALSLPCEKVHPLLEVIARDTGLTLEQVREEQRQRSAGAAEKKTMGAVREVWDPYCVRPDRLRK